MIDRLEEAVLAGQPRAIARAITIVERGGAQAEQLVARLRPSARGGHLVGLTGSPGAGKSSLISSLAKEYRSRGMSVGVIAVDPSSPFSGGAVLGDRIRMQELATDPGVFVRSMASRGRLGGLAAAVEDAAVIMRAAGKDVILLETVGVGQGELDVASVVQTVVVILTPGMGDEIQSIKAGVLEVADVYAVNKGDLPGADSVARSLHSVADVPGSDWVRPIVQTSVVTNAGIANLADAIASHREYIQGRRTASQQEIQRTSKSVLSHAGRLLLDRLEATVDPERLEIVARAVAEGKMDPREAAEEVGRLFLAARSAANTEAWYLELAGTARSNSRSAT